VDYMWEELRGGDKIRRCELSAQYSSPFKVGLVQRSTLSSIPGDVLVIWM
jgi:hypothetical protein